MPNDPWWCCGRALRTHATSDGCLSSAFLEPVQFPGLADRLALMLSPLTPPTRLAPLGEAGDDVCTHRLLGDIGGDPRLTIQYDNIIVHKCAGTLPLQGQGETFAIRCFKGEMRLKLGLVLF